MPLYKKDNVTIFYSHIPKTAGSSIGEIFSRHAFERYLFSNNMEPCSWQHRHKSDPELINLLAQENVDFKFTVIRNPVERIISEYYMRRMEKEKTNEDDFHMFVDHVFTQYQKFPFINDNHIRPQNEFIHDGMEVFEFGDWNSLMDRLNQFYNFGDYKFPHMNRSTESETSSTYIDTVKKWKPKSETIEMIMDFYKEDLKYFKNEGLYSL
jgi:hypothetical protein